MSLRYTALTLALLLSTACVTTPYDYTAYSSGNTDRSITFSGYTETPSETVTLQALSEGTWTTFATATTSSSPKYSASRLPWSDARNLYAWQVTTQIGSGGSLWERNETVEIRISSPSVSSLVGFNDYSEITCMLSETGTRSAAYASCVDSAIYTLHLVDID
jgi:hypothetical protein